MHITHLTEHDTLNPDSRSGTPFWISKGLMREGIELENLYVSTPQRLLPPWEEFAFRCKQWWLKFYKKTHLSPDFFTRRAQYIANNLKDRLDFLKTDVILTSVTPIASAFLETSIPLVYWTDAVYAALVGFYPNFRFHHPDTNWDGHFITTACLNKAKLLIFSSDWAARTAVDFYGVSQNKIKVVPFGANLDITHNYSDIKNIIAARKKNPIKLLFVGKQWYRKGGDIALEVVEKLNTAGYCAELTIVGCNPPQKQLPSYVKVEKFISKKKSDEIEKLKKLYQESHFLILPSRADACPIVLAEANAFGLPCLTTYVGGISTAIRNNINGMTFSLEAYAQDYCDFIINIISNEKAYESLALSAFNEYQTRLNWKTASSQVKQLIAEII